MLNKLFKTIPSLVLILLLSLPAFAQPRQFTIGVEDLYYRPFYYMENGAYKGVSRKILDAFSKKNNLVFKYKALPVYRLYKEFLSGGVDFKYPDNSYWKGEAKKGYKIAYSRPVIDFIDGVMVKPENLGKGVRQLKVLGTVLGFTPWSYRDLIKSGKVRVIENNSFDGLLEQVIMGRINGGYMNPVVARYQLRHVLKKPGALVFDPSLPHINDSYRLSSLKYPDIIDALNRFLKENAKMVRDIKLRHDIATK